MHFYTSHTIKLTFEQIFLTTELMKCQKKLSCHLHTTITHQYYCALLKNGSSVLTTGNTKQSTKPPIINNRPLWSRKFGETKKLCWNSCNLFLKRERMPRQSISVPFVSLKNLPTMHALFFTTPYACTHIGNLSSYIYALGAAIAS